MKLYTIVVVRSAIADERRFVTVKHVGLFAYRQEALKAASAIEVGKVFDSSSDMLVESVAVDSVDLTPFGVFADVALELALRKKEYL